MSEEQAASVAPERIPWSILVAVVLAWFGLWYLTPGLLSDGAGRLVTDDAALSTLFETVLALMLAIGLVLAHRGYSRELFARSRTCWFYALPIATAIALPFHYGLELPVALYLFWMTVSVFWQDYLTFGLLQKYLAERLTTSMVLIASAVIFWAGHAIFLPDAFAPTQGLPSLAILALGLVLASLRIWLTTLHVILALHLTFYFVFA